ncbi:MAG: NAD(P)H-hydrate dehydratase [Betaproteobacteria bacterium]
MDCPATPPTPVYSIAEIRAIEARVLAGSPSPPLMERAGLAAADLALKLAGERRRVLVLAGPGNNGGDALVAARHLRDRSAKIAVVFDGDAGRLPRDAREALDRWLAAGGTLGEELPPLGDFDLVVDGLFGIGLTRDVTGRTARWIDTLNGSPPVVLSLDVPSGLHADTGRILGTCVRADHTLTFLGLKPGLLTMDGPDCAGTIHATTLGLTPVQLGDARGHLTGTDVIRRSLPLRRRNTHKGTYGDVVVVGGAEGMTGAALLAGRAALLMGAGRVRVAMLAPDAPAVDVLHPELMLRRVDDTGILDGATAVVAGPGIGQSAHAGRMLDRILALQVPLVLDADALNLVALDEQRAAATARRLGATLLTPHPAEAARLLACTTAEVQHDRVSAALRIARRLNAWTVLKGAGSVCAGPDGSWFLNMSGNPGMAAPGMGDVLAGILGAFLARGIDPGDALQAGVHLHGLAGDDATALQSGTWGLTAGEVALAARRVANRFATS